ncbi:hypothetical protein J2S17_002743 [Cytobacillus purgationiresistens]|uniref:Uncharacterized protein n=1 Tax=Cytobacillus purgationiresistens TaxID=863449 RepID=A0ABU0AI08_9BACI|nr:hypothetical protein [Cytobacillus purgationiresistens]
MFECQQELGHADVAPQDLWRPYYAIIGEQGARAF